MILFVPVIILIGWIFHVHSIKFTFCLVLGVPIPILYISSNISYLFLDSPVFNIVNYLNINLVEFPSFIVGVGKVLLPPPP